MNIKIWPRKKNDKGGYACMPLKKKRAGGARWMETNNMS